MLKRINDKEDLTDTAVRLGDASFPAPFPSGLEYGSPARGAWNIVHTAMAVFVMMAADDIRVIRKRVGKQCFYLCIRFAVCSGIKHDPRLGKCCPCAAADTAADQSVDAVIFQKSCQRAMQRRNFPFPF